MLIIFDCDGVLVDSEILAKKIERAVYEKQGYKASIDEFCEAFSGLTGKEIMAAIEEKLERRLPDYLQDDVQRQINERLASELNPIDDVHEMLDRLDSPCCICSNSSMERLQISLKQTRLFDRFHPYIYSAVEVGDKLPKPSANVFLHAAQALGALPSDTIVLEDSVHGVSGATKAGMRVVGFTGGSHTYPTHAENLMEAGAETTINRLLDFPAIAVALREWNGRL